MTWTAGAANGATAGEIQYQYSVEGGAWSGNWASGGTNGSGTISGSQVANNGSYSVRVRAVSTVDGSQFASGASNTSNKVAPYGPIGNPTAKASGGNRTITMSWSSPARNGRDITTQINTDDGRGWRTVAASGSESYSVGYSVTRTISVRTTAEGQTTTASASATSDPKPAPRIWVTRGSFENAGCVNGCYHFVVNWQNAEDLGTKDVRCQASTGRVGSYDNPVNFSGGSGSQELTCYLGADGYDVWVDVLGWGSSVDTEKRNWPRN